MPYGSDLAVPAGPRWIPCSDLKPVGVAHLAPLEGDSFSSNSQIFIGVLVLIGIGINTAPVGRTGVVVGVHAA
jgi:hypothetical protein